MSGLIEIENPNRVAHKTKKATDIEADDAAKPQLSRRERFVVSTSMRVVPVVC